MSGQDDGITTVEESASWERLIAEGMEGMSKAERQACVRFAFRLLNDDKKVRRLIAMEETGQITARQLVMMC